MSRLNASIMEGIPSAGTVKIQPMWTGFGYRMTWPNRVQDDVAKPGTLGDALLDCAPVLTILTTLVYCHGADNTMISYCEYPITFTGD